jgi:hypothetical protein
MTQAVTPSNINLLNYLKIVVKNKHITKNKVQFFKKYYEKLSKKIKQLPLTLQMQKATNLIRLR